MGRSARLPVRVYVAGSIMETVRDQNWRVEWKEWLKNLDLGIVVVDPVIERGGLGIGDLANEENRAYIRRNDRMLVESCHVLLIVHDLKVFSIGTWVEMAWARDKWLYIVLFVPNPDIVSKIRARNAFLQTCNRIIFDDRDGLRQVFENFQSFEQKLL